MTTRWQWMLGCLLVVPLSMGADPLDGLDATITAAMKKAEIPGLSIAIVKDGKVVLCRGFGVKKLGQEDAVDERTVFAIGSTTKAFTATTLAMLVSEGRLAWDDPVTKYLPGFELADPYITRELTVRDLLSHRAGLPDHGGDLLFFGYPYNRNELMRRVRYLKGDSSFRSRYAYQNLMYMIAGELAGAVAGRPWDALVSERILVPLGMEDTSTTIRSLANHANVASPHYRIEEKWTPIEYRNIDSAGGAGCLNSSSHDLSKWVQLLLQEGKWENKPLWKAEAGREMYRPQTILRLEGPRVKAYPEAHFVCYGFGWFLSDYRGRKLIQHGGNVDGMTAFIGLVPEEKLGVVVLANREGVLSLRGIFLQILDRYMGKIDHDRFAEMWEVEQELLTEQKAKEKATLDRKIADTKPSLPLADYVGSYSSPLYGDASVQMVMDEERLRLRIGTMVGDLTHFHHDTFLVKWQNPADGRNLIRFSLSDLSKIAGFRMTELAKPDQGDYLFNRTVLPTTSPK